MNVHGTPPRRRFSHTVSVVESGGEHAGGGVVRILVYGGCQLGGQTALYDVREMRVELGGAGEDGAGQEEMEATAAEEEEEAAGGEVAVHWSSPAVEGNAPGDREGPATYIIGRRMVLVGGHVPPPASPSAPEASEASETESSAQAASSAQAESVASGDDDKPTPLPMGLLVFDPKPTPRWFRPALLGHAAPARRCGLGLSLVGCALLMSGGYETDATEARARLLQKTDAWRLKWGQSTPPTPAPGSSAGASKVMMSNKK